MMVLSTSPLTQVPQVELALCASAAELLKLKYIRMGSIEVVLQLAMRLMQLMLGQKRRAGNLTTLLPNLPRFTLLSRKLSTIS